MKCLRICHSQFLIFSLFHNFLFFNKGDTFTILDLGCGFGKHSREVAKLYPNSKIFGIDMDERSIEHAKKEISTCGPNNIEYFCTKGGNLPKEWIEKFDFVIINDVLHDSYEVDDILKETKRVLKADGYAAAYDPPVSSCHLKVVQDVLAQFYLPCSFFHCLPVSSMGPSGEGLGIGWGYERKKQKIEEHGFRLIQVGDKDVNTIQEGIVFQKLLKRKGSNS